MELLFTLSGVLFLFFYLLEEDRAPLGSLVLEKGVMLGVTITAMMILDYKHKMHTYLRYT